MIFPTRRFGPRLALGLAVLLAPIAVLAPPSSPAFVLAWMFELPLSCAAILLFLTVKELIFDCANMRWRYRHGIWRSVVVAEGSFDELAALVLDFVLRQGLVVSLVFRDRREPLALGDFLAEGSAHSGITALARELRLPAFDCTGPTPKPLSLDPA